MKGVYFQWFETERFQRGVKLMSTGTAHTLLRSARLRCCSTIIYRACCVCGECARHPARRAPLVSLSPPRQRQAPGKTAWGEACWRLACSYGVRAAPFCRRERPRGFVRCVIPSRTAYGKNCFFFPGGIRRRRRRRRSESAGEKRGRKNKMG